MHWQNNYRDYILSGKCGGSGKDAADDDDGDEDATELERWQNVEVLVDMARQYVDRPLRLDMPDIDAEAVLPEVLRAPVRAWWPRDVDHSFQSMPAPWAIAYACDDAVPNVSPPA